MRQRVNVTARMPDDSTREHGSMDSERPTFGPQ